MLSKQSRFVLLALMLVLVVGLVSMPMVAQAATPSVSKLTFTASSLSLGTSGANTSYDLKLLSASYANGKTHKNYGFPEDITYATSNPSVASVQPLTDGKGVRIMANPGQTGVVSITASVNGVVKGRCTVRVMAVVKATGVTLNKASITRYSTTVRDDPENPYRAYKLVYKISPSTASANGDRTLYEFKSSKPSVAEVDQDGNILALSVGKTTISLNMKDGSKLQKCCVVTVKALPVQALSLKEGKSIGLQPGETLQLTPEISPSTVSNKAVTYSTSKSSVATVTSAGVIKAVGTGTAKITAKSKSGGKTATITVVVDYKYRFYGVSNGAYRNIDKLYNYNNDINAMIRTFGAARFNGGKIKLSYKKNLTAAQIKSYVRSISENPAIGEDDVTIFYYSGHGADSYYQEYVGALAGVDATWYDNNGLVSLGTLIEYLSRIPGQVVVYLDSCYSGAMIASKGAQATAMRNAERTLINQIVVNAFAKASSSGSVSGMATKDMDPARHAQFHVLTGCAYNEVSYAGPIDLTGERSVLSYFMQQGLYSQKGEKMLADKNGDKQVSLNELHQYVKPLVYDFSRLRGADGPSNVQVWPQNDQMAIFAMN